LSKITGQKLYHNSLNERDECGLLVKWR
jgi:hypothetical protein